jgi:Predicted membrane protein
MYPSLMITSIIIDVLNYVGIIAFAASGALKAIDKDMDLLGVIVLGFSTALAGGITRDVLLGVFPPINIVYLPYPITAITAAIATLPFSKYVMRGMKPFLYADALGLGAFTAIGAQVAFMHGLNPLGVAMLASITAVGGGVLRDLLANEVPMVLSKEVYATASIIGGFTYWLLAMVIPFGDDALIVTVLVSAIRIIAIERKWSLPRARSLTEL